MASFLLAFILIVIVALYSKYKKLKDESKRLLKHFKTPPRIPFWGATKVFEGANFDPIEIFHTIASFPAKYGPNFLIFNLFNATELVVSRPQDLEKIMSGHTTKKGLSYSFIQPWLGEGLLTSFGAKWFSRRKLITSTFHFKILLDFLEVFNEQDKKLIEKLEKYVDGTECNIYEHITAVALDNICETAMGVKINAQDDPNSEYIRAVKEMSELIFNRFFSFLAQLPILWHFTPDAWRSRRVVKVLHRFTDSVIINRRKQLLSKGQHTRLENDENHGKKQRHSFLDMLLQAKNDGEPLSHLDIREEVDTFMFEGHDTTTSCMSFAMYHLAMHADVQERAFEEIRKVMGDDPSTPCTANDLQEMKYLEKVIKETLRLHPSVPFIGRATLEPIEIQGVMLPKNYDLTIPIYAIHRNPEFFPDPEKFDPERFDEEKERSWGPYDYIPFSAGTRNCIGQKFAMLEMKAVISSILRNYKVVPTEKTKNLVFRCDLILRPVNGLYVKLQRREYL